MTYEEYKKEKKTELRKVLESLFIDESGIDKKPNFIERLFGKKEIKKEDCIIINGQYIHKDDMQIVFDVISAQHIEFLNILGDRKVDDQFIYDMFYDALDNGFDKKKRLEVALEKLGLEPSFISCHGYLRIGLQKAFDDIGDDSIDK